MHVNHANEGKGNILSYLFELFSNAAKEFGLSLRPVKSLFYDFLLRLEGKKLGLLSVNDTSISIDEASFLDFLCNSSNNKIDTKQNLKKNKKNLPYSKIFITSTRSFLENLRFS